MITPWRVVKDCVLLHISLVPKSSVDLVEGIIEGPTGCVLRVKVRALPDKGKANQAVLHLLSKWLKIPKSSFELTSGARSKLKTIKISGDLQEILKKLETALKLGLG